MRLTILFFAMILSACGDGLQNPLRDYEFPEFNDSPGGIWIGTRATGTEVVVLLTEDGDFRMLDPFGNVGFGQLDVDESNNIDLDYDIAPPFMDTIFDGSSGATCEAVGTLTERVLLDTVTACTSTMGLEFGGALSLAFSDMSARASSLGAIAGIYDDFGDILSIDSAGVLFEQSAATGCVITGQVSIVDPNWNVYRASFTTDNCMGDHAPLNGSSWQGVLSLIDDAGTDVIFGGFHTQVGSDNVGLVIALPRI